jgi:hypothetical protein
MYTPEIQPPLKRKYERRFGDKRQDQPDMTGDPVFDAARTSLKRVNLLRPQP